MVPIHNMLNTYRLLLICAIVSPSIKYSNVKYLFVNTILKTAAIVLSDILMEITDINLWNYDSFYRQYYAYITDVRSKRLGTQCWVFMLVCLDKFNPYELKSKVIILINLIAELLHLSNFLSA